MLKYFKDILGITRRDEEIKSLTEALNDKNLSEQLQNIEIYTKNIKGGAFSRILGENYYKFKDFYMENEKTFDYLRQVKNLPEIKKFHGDHDFYDWLFMGSYIEWKNKEAKKEFDRKNKGI